MVSPSSVAPGETAATPHPIPELRGHHGRESRDCISLRRELAPIISHQLVTCTWSSYPKLLQGLAKNLAKKWHPWEDVLCTDTLPSVVSASSKWRYCLKSTYQMVFIRLFTGHLLLKIPVKETSSSKKTKHKTRDWIFIYYDHIMKRNTQRRPRTLNLSPEYFTRRFSLGREQEECKVISPGPGVVFMSVLVLAWLCSTRWCDSLSDLCGISSWEVMSSSDWHHCQPPLFPSRRFLRRF